MPPRLRLPAKRVRLTPRCERTTASARVPRCAHTYASLASAAATTSSSSSLPPPPPINSTPLQSPISRLPSTAQPPPYKPAAFRKTQLHRQYQSLLRSSPLLLLFQHNNLKAVEWSGVRRELAAALKQVDDAAQGGVGEEAKLQIVQTGIFASAMGVVEALGVEQKKQQSKEAATPLADPMSSSSTVLDTQPFGGLTKEAWVKSKRLASTSDLGPLMSGPVAVLALPAVSPAHLAAALTILAPNKQFPAPKRRVSPGLYESAVQTGLQKLMLLGARVEGKVFDMDGTRWVGGIEGGLDGLRATLVAMLQGFGAGLTGALEGASRSLYLTVEGRRMDMEEKEKPAEEKKAE